MKKKTEKNIKFIFSQVFFPFTFFLSYQKLLELANIKTGLILNDSILIKYQFYISIIDNYAMAIYMISKFIVLEGANKIYFMLLSERKKPKT